MITLFLPRGIRNNNPGNIRLSKTVWQGQRAVQEDLEFVQFDAPLYGLRALMKTLLTYYLKYNLDTVASIINRYAPPHENATDRYAQRVATEMKVRRTDKIDLTNRSTLLTLTRAIVRHENGNPPPGRPEGWYGDDLYAAAADLVMTVNA